MKFQIMDVNNGGEIVALIESNNGKNALRVFRRGLLSTGFYEIYKCQVNWTMTSSYGGTWYAMPIGSAVNN